MFGGFFGAAGSKDEKEDDGTNVDSGAAERRHSGSKSMVFERKKGASKSTDEKDDVTEIYAPQGATFVDQEAYDQALQAFLDANPEMQQEEIEERIREEGNAFIDFLFFWSTTTAKDVKLGVSSDDGDGLHPDYWTSHRPYLIKHDANAPHADDEYDEGIQPNQSTPNATLTNPISFLHSLSPLISLTIDHIIVHSLTSQYKKYVKNLRHVSSKKSTMKSVTLPPTSSPRLQQA